MHQTAPCAPGPRALTPPRRRSAWAPLAAALAASLLATLSACGGGGGGDKQSLVTPSGDQGGETVTLTGVLSMVETAAVDSDTNDDHQANSRSNDDIDTAQPLITPVHVVGTVNEPGRGPAGRNQVKGDEFDGFSVQLETDQTVELDFTSDTADNDLDLYILDSESKVVGESIGEGSHECVRISKPGRYLVVVQAYQGSGVYNLNIGSPGSAVGCSNATGAPTPASLNRLVALVDNRATALGTQRARPSAATLVQTAGLRMSATPTGAPSLIHMPETAAARTAGLQALRKRLGLQTAGTAADATEHWGLGSSRMQLVAYAKTLRHSASFSYVSPDQVVYRQALVETFPPNDPFYPEQRWHYEQINLPSAMNRLAGLSGLPTVRPIVAVVDSGLVVEHPDFIGQTVSGRTFLSRTTGGDSNSADPNDPANANTPPETAGFHGTHVAGTIAARTWDNIGAAGVAPMAQIMPLRVFDPSSPYTNTYDVINAMLYAAGLDNNSGLKPSRRADVINLSLGSSSSCLAAYADTIQRVRQAGVIVVAAAGNDAQNNRGIAVAVGTPANCPGAISVGALNVYRKQAPYSQSGPGLSLAAPGGDATTSSTGSGIPDLIVSTIGVFADSGERRAGIGRYQGTSMATPHVAGVMALMKYVHPALTPAEAETWINTGAITDDVEAVGRDNATGMGLINARKAVDRALQAASAGGGSTSPSPVGEVVASPFALDFGTGVDSLTFRLLTTASTTEVVQAVSPSSPMLTVTAVDTDAQTGLGLYRVQVNRSSLPAGSSAFPEVTVRTNTRTLTLKVTVVKGDGTSGSARLPDYGQIYVLAIDAKTGEALNGTEVSASGGHYRWQLKATAGRPLLLVAGADLDHNDTICDPGEPCGGFPLLSSLTTLNPAAQMGSIDFSLAPMGTGGVTIKGAGVGGPAARTVPVWRRPTQP